MAPLLGGAEVAAVTRLEPCDAVGQQGLQFVGPLERRVRRSAGGQSLIDDRQRGQRAGDELGQVANDLRRLKECVNVFRRQASEKASSMTVPPNKPISPAILC